MHLVKHILLLATVVCLILPATAQKNIVKLVKEKAANRINVLINDKLFTSFFYPDTLEKPVLYPICAASGTVITRGFPLNPRPGEPTDHPHHVGMWFTFENVNGLDFWNNSFAIPKEKKSLYGWIRTDRIIETTDGITGSLTYHANWTNQQKQILLAETTRLYSAAQTACGLLTEQLRSQPLRQ